MKRIRATVTLLLTLLGLGLLWGTLVAVIVRGTVQDYYESGLAGEVARLRGTQSKPLEMPSR